jgi:hypothetical protein
VEFEVWRSLLRRSSDFIKDCSCRVLEPHLSNLHRGKLVFSHVVSFDEIAPRKNPGLKLTRTDVIFKNFYIKRFLKPNTNLIWNLYKKLSAGLPNLVRQSL